MNEPAETKYELLVGRQRACAEELRAYLLKHLERAAACVLLITERSMARNSGAVAWEIEVGTQLAHTHAVRFMPALLAVGYEALGMRATGAPSRRQQFEFGSLDGGAPEHGYDAPSRLLQPVEFGSRGDRVPERDFFAISVTGKHATERLVDELADVFWITWVTTGSGADDTQTVSKRVLRPRVRSAASGARRRRGV